jgi:hypothetical protein
VADRDEVRECHNALPGQGYRTIQKVVKNDNGYYKLRGKPKTSGVKSGQVSLRPPSNEPEAPKLEVSILHTHQIYGMIYTQTWGLLTSKTQMNVLAKRDNLESVNF